MAMRAVAGSLRRAASTDASSTAAAAASNTAAPAAVQAETKAAPKSSRTGIFFTGLIGGAAIASVLSYLRLADQVKDMFTVVRQQVSLLQGDVSQIKTFNDRASALEAEVKLLQAEAARVRDVQAMKKLMEEERESLLKSLAKHKADVWAAQEELYKAMERLEKLQGSK
eukprot:m.48240 g.48240  ORF g.48240 m.48240 type:complete len:169 (+) comp12711_c0_seq1:48-554(+)